MGSRQADSLALVKRCKDAGWEAVRNGDGYKIRTPEGPVVIHLTYSDYKSLSLVTRTLERNGLVKAEENVTQAKAASRTAAALKAEAAAKAALTRAQAEQEKVDHETYAKAIARASGPYAEPEDVPLEWFAQSHPRPWMRWVYMTPHIARYLLDNHNTSAAIRKKDPNFGKETTNRPLRDSRVDHYRKIIERGHWHLTHQGMAMDNAEPVPNLQDGQHRLHAIIKASEDDPFLKLAVPFFVGMPVENFRAIDEGLNRSANDLLARGGESYGSVIGACVRLALAFQDQSPRRRIRESQTNEVVTEFFKGDPDELRAAARYGALNYKKLEATAGPLSAARYLLRRANGPDNRYVEAFFSGLTTGRKTGTRLVLDDNDPRKVTREYFHNAQSGKKKMPPLETLAVIIMAWNNVVEDRRPRYMRFTDDMPVPRIILLKDDQGDDAERYAPRALGGEVAAASEDS